MEEAFMSSIMRELNSNLAVSKPSLMEMMDGGDRTYHMRDGSVIEIPEEQLRTIWDACDDSQRLRLRLPIYVSTDITGEGSAWKVEGSAEAAAVARILGRKVYRDGYLRLYHPDLRDLRSKIPDAVLVVFTP